MEQTNPVSPWYPYVWVDPERMGGEPCFRGTRLPVRILFEYLSDGSTLEEFIEAFDAPRDMVEGVLRLTADEIERGVRGNGGAQAA
jgi:uncharacterized protein (DUF433 family)